MSDIVKRLRDNGPSLMRAKHASAWVTECGQRMLEAADEIERRDETIRQQDNEIERLRKRLAAANDPTTNSKSTDWSEGPAQP